MQQQRDAEEVQAKLEILRQQAQQCLEQAQVRQQVLEVTWVKQPPPEEHARGGAGVVRTHVRGSWLS